MAEARWVATDRDLAELIEVWGTTGALAIDTEFHRERTYFPKLALVQIAWRQPGDAEGAPPQIALVDPIGVDIAPLREVLDADVEIIMHAASQDLEVLDLACGTVPSKLFDTQVAAGFVGYSTPSLATLSEGELGIKLAKGDRLTDWLRRPLGPEQLSYAADDVAHLHVLHDRLVAKLTEADRLSWALDECELLRQRGRGMRNPDEAWLRIKEARTLRGKAAGSAQSLAAWRERRAAEIDQPVRFVLGDMGLVGIAQRGPTTLEGLRGIRGVEERHTRGRIGEELLAAVAEGRKNEPRRPRPDGPELDRKLRPAVTLVSAWLSQLARDLSLDMALLATRTDIEEFLAGAPDARLAHGWRAEVVGDPIRRLVGGEAALAFDGKGGLVLEPRIGHEPA